MIDAGLYNSAEKIFSTYAQRLVHGEYERLRIFSYAYVIPSFKSFRIRFGSMYSLLYNSFANFFLSTRVKFSAIWILVFAYVMKEDTTIFDLSLRSSCQIFLHSFFESFSSRSKSVSLLSCSSLVGTILLNAELIFLSHVCNKGLQIVIIDIYHKGHKKTV